MWAIVNARMQQSSSLRVDCARWSDEQVMLSGVRLLLGSMSYGLRVARLGELPNPLWFNFPVKRRRAVEAGPSGSRRRAEQESCDDKHVRGARLLASVRILGSLF